MEDHKTAVAAAGQRRVQDTLTSESEHHQRPWTEPAALVQIVMPILLAVVGAIIAAMWQIGA
jgi:hypothetical protein